MIVTKPTQNTDFINIIKNRKKTHRRAHAL